ncbi:MAG: hypothetical protein HQ483_07355 [Rhodospirillales bacterium]|nr:hypothetical protein [Rhodospirillales bacterium]
MEKSEEQKRQRFLLETEQMVRDTNREIIHERVPELTQAQIRPIVETVARARAHYLEVAFRVADLGDQAAFDENGLKELRQSRERYEESRAAFDALTRAIERGYVDIED